jgi:acetyl esterase/lipase
MPEVGSVTLYKVKVDKPAGEILARVYYPTEEAIEAGGLKTADGRLPVHFNIHGGKYYSTSESSPLLY